MKPYYSDGSVTIYHGEACATLAGLDAGSVDVLLTDPPYSSGGMFRSDRGLDPVTKYRGWSQDPTGKRRSPTAQYSTFAGDSRDQRSWMVWVSAWTSESLRLVRPGGHGFLFSDWRQLPAATDAVQCGGWTWRGLVIWDKGSGRPMKGRFRNHLEYIVWSSHGAIAPTDDYPSGLISVPTVPTSERQHVTQKPVRLMQELLRVLPRDDQLTVLDPFAGAGSTLVAARASGHRAVGIEMDERNCEIAAERLSQGAFDFGGAA